MRSHVCPRLVYVSAALLMLAAPPTGHGGPGLGRNPIAAENLRNGTTEWLVRAPRQNEIAGYTDDVSYTPGSTVRLFVDTKGAPFTFEIFRMGFYGGAGGRLVGQAGPISNTVQPTSTVQDDRVKGAKLLLTNWHESTSFTIPLDWVSGFYLIKLTRVGTAGSSYASFVVRSPDPDPVVLVIPTSTYQAYNYWGRLSLYRDNRPASRMRGERARQVSFLRPHSWGHGAGFFFNRERPLVEWLEARGYPVSYATDRDAFFGRLVGSRTRLVILSGHPEYHSLAERKLYAGLGARGVSLAIFGGNSFVTQARFSADGQIETVWRSRALDPVKGPRASVRWELTGWRQSALTGSMDGAGAMGPLRAVGTRHWGWAGAGVGEGRVVGRVQGWEQDGVTADRSTPRGLQVLARAYSPRGTRVRPRVASMTISPGPRRTFVFNAAQNAFTWNFGYPAYPGVDRAKWVGLRYPASSRENKAMKRLAGNVIARATGLPNPEPARPGRPRAVAPLTVLSPRGNDVRPILQPLVVVWAAAPRAATRVRISVDGRRVATVPARRSTWIGSRLRSGGNHVIRLVALTASGRVVASETRAVMGVSPRSRVFRVRTRWGELWRAWV